MILYLSGPMSGYADHNKPLFNAGASALRAHGYHVFNPAEFPNATKTWEDCLRYDIVELMKCQGIATLTGWSKSRGASLEVHIGRELGMTIRQLSEWLV